MKKIFLSAGLIFVGFICFAQNFSKNINWLKENNGRIDHVHCPTSDFFGDIYEITDEWLRLYSDDDDKECKINWSDVDLIEQTGGYIFIVSNEYIGNRPIALKVFINSESNAFYYKYHLNKVVKGYNDYFNK